MKTGVGRAAARQLNHHWADFESDVEIQLEPDPIFLHLFQLQVHCGLPDALLHVSAGTGCFLFLENRLSAGRWRLP